MTLRGTGRPLENLLQTIDVRVDRRPTVAFGRGVGHACIKEVGTGNSARAAELHKLAS